MSYADAVLLGLVQGLTEFLPVSSSGHLVLVEALLGAKQPGVSFEVLVHVGTLAAVLLYFRAHIARLIRSVFDRSMTDERRLIVFLIVGSLPAGLAGLLFAGFFESVFSDPLVTSVMLIVTGLVLLSTRLVRTGKAPISLPACLVMGLGQAAAIMPGISRSGSTISAGLLAGVEPTRAAEFSFLLAIPAILGAAALNVGELLTTDRALAGQYAVGTLCAFVTGLAAVYALMTVVKRGKLHYFSYYCFAAGAAGLYLFL